MRDHLTPTKLGLFLSVFLGMFVLYANDYFNPVPYGQVEILEVTQKDDRIFLKANFVKVKCTFNALQVQTEHFGQWNEAPWSNEDQHTEDDRMAGEETLSISFDGNQQTVDRVQVKTRHLCDGKKVDKTFASFTLADHIK